MAKEVVMAVAEMAVVRVVRRGRAGTRMAAVVVGAERRSGKILVSMVVVLLYWLWLWW